MPFLCTVFDSIPCTFRQFLWSFRLPGEAQKIDRMMECFAERYCELNPEHFSSTGKRYGTPVVIVVVVVEFFSRFY